MNERCELDCLVVGGGTFGTALAWLLLQGGKRVRLWVLREAQAEEINREHDETYPDLKMVGWYHSHPGFGVFLSGHDLFIHRNFFTAPWQVAFVTDPLGKASGCFTWNNGELKEDSDFCVFRSNAHPPAQALG